MKSEIEIERELRNVRKSMADCAVDDNSMMLYGAQQALCWVLGKGISPSDLDKVVKDFVKELAAKENAHG